jgi:hypothetical protein
MDRVTNRHQLESLRRPSKFDHLVRKAGLVSENALAFTDFQKGTFHWDELFEC